MEILVFTYGLHRGAKAAEVLHLSSEDEVAELRERQEDDEEHDGEASQILGAARQRGGQLSHGFAGKAIYFYSSC